MSDINKNTFALKDVVGIVVGVLSLAGVYYAMDKRLTVVEGELEDAKRIVYDEHGITLASRVKAAEVEIDKWKGFDTELFMYKMEQLQDEAKRKANVPPQVIFRKSPVEVPKPTEVPEKKKKKGWF